jgi:hypothetical protein
MGEMTSKPERDMAAIQSKVEREPRSEFELTEVLSALWIGASFEEIANFLIDNISEREGGFWAASQASVTPTRAVDRPMTFNSASVRPLDIRQLP